MKSVSRISLDFVLQSLFKKIKPGVVLDVGSGAKPYMDQIPCTKYMTLDIDKDTKPDICCDVEKIKWKSNYFDTVIATEILEHIQNPQKAIDEIYRILKKNGVCILSTRFIQSYHPVPSDYYRFTRDSLSHLFRKFSKVEIEHHGNRIQTLWHLITCDKAGFFLKVFNPIVARIYIRKTKFPLGFVVYAKK